ncbi:hypothetical protein [Nocardia bovistercoris]|uniref:Uncharacterized protein n=1 Tax=Nocardia bovistercoris TaxID=2785916 RepID=A0A931N6X8_9NOCA|nr:hypothetical protein [Nocardia bovistercoris]MBH0781011.1 hypothetical protein [Nocardia bovistercoris]
MLALDDRRDFRGLDGDRHGAVTRSESGEHAISDGGRERPEKNSDAEFELELAHSIAIDGDLEASRVTPRPMPTFFESELLGRCPVRVAPEWEKIAW